MKVARERKSSVLASNAVHHRIDSFTGIVTLVAILGANFLQNAAWLDPVGGLLISLLVVRAGWGNTMSALYELVDKSIDEDVRQSVRMCTRRALDEENNNNNNNSDNDNNIDILNVTGVKSGQNYLVEIQLAVPGDLQVWDLAQLERAVRDRVGRRVRGVRKVKIRFVPRENMAASQFDEFIPAEVSPRSSPEPDDFDDNNDNDDDDKDEHHKKK